VFGKRNLRLGAGSGILWLPSSASGNVTFVTADA
jgi:hypothetical protein